MTKKRACVTIDLDTPASDLRAAGPGAGALRRRSYERAVPRLLELLGSEGVRATFFAVGSDAADPVCAGLLRDIVRAGHEVASHSLSHDRNLPLAKSREILREVIGAGRLLELAVGKPPRGFRSPGAVLSADLLAALRSAGCLYDSSLNSSLVYNAAKALYGRFLGTSLPATFALRTPSEPYFPAPGAPLERSTSGPGLLEFPLTAAAGLGIPFMSYFLSRLGALGRASVRRTAAHGAFINLVLHDHEFLERSDLSGLEVPRGLTTPGAAGDLSGKINFVKWTLREIGRSHAFATMETYATDILSGD